MSFLIFAFRKLFLKRQINEKSFRLMQLSMRKNDITEEIGNVQQAFGSAKNMVSIFSSNTIMSAQKSIMEKYTDKDGELKEGCQNKAMEEWMNAQQQNQMQTAIVNQLFETASKSQLQMLNITDTQISTEMASIESQLKQLNAELESVEKGETEAAKQEAPKYGLS